MFMITLARDTVIMDKPKLIKFPQIGETAIGFISVGQVNESIPFDIKRIFWTYYTPESIIRGRHAHYQTEMVLIAVAGRIVLNTEIEPGKIETFVLDKPNEGVYMPAMCWHTMQYSHTAVQVVLTNTEFDSKDYIRSYSDFVKEYHRRSNS